MEKLLPFIAGNGQQMLYICNRVALRNQLLNKYKHKELKENGIVRENENLTIGMYQSITNAINKGNEAIYEENYDYLILDEAHLIYDAADYDLNSYLFMEFIDKLDAVIIMMSGTPNSISQLQPYTKKKLKIVSEPNKNNNPIRNIYLVEDNTTFEELRYKYVDKRFKWIELVSFSKQFNDKKYKYSSYNVATLLSESNKSKERYMPKGSYDERVLNGIVFSEKMIADFIFTTKSMDVGVNIKADTNFVVAFDGVEMLNTYEQMRSRVRVQKDSNYIVDLIFHVQRPKKWQIELLQNKLEYINKLYAEFGGYEEVVFKHNLAIGERIRRDSIIQEKDFNPIARDLIAEKLIFSKKCMKQKIC